jgi:hypothetical protein
MTAIAMITHVTIRFISGNEVDSPSLITIGYFGTWKDDLVFLALERLYLLKYIIFLLLQSKPTQHGNIKVIYLQGAADYCR